MDLPTPPNTPPRRTRICDLPPAGRTEIFIGRETDLRDIEKFLAGPGLEKHLTVRADRGVGSTQLVLQYAKTHREQYDTIIWFDASSQERLKAKIMGFYDFLGAGNDPTLATLAVACNGRKYEVMRKWFENQEKCLIIYDNVGFGEAYNLQNYLPQHCAAHRIAIGHQPCVRALGNYHLELEPMTLDDAVAMFSAVAGLPERHARDARGLIVEELDRTPFYIANRARRFWDTQACSLLEFLEDLRRERKKLVADDGSRIWAFDFERIKGLKDSLTLLYLFACLDGFDINSKL